MPCGRRAHGKMRIFWYTPYAITHLPCASCPEGQIGSPPTTSSPASSGDQLGALIYVLYGPLRVGKFVWHSCQPQLMISAPVPWVLCQTIKNRIAPHFFPLLRRHCGIITISFTAVPCVCKKEIPILEIHVVSLTSLQIDQVAATDSISKKVNGESFPFIHHPCAVASTLLVK